MLKGVVLHFVVVLTSYIEKQDTHYIKAIPTIVRVYYTLYKLAQGATLLQCSESFAIGVTTISKMLRHVVRAINVEFRGQIQWPTRNQVSNVMTSF